VADHIHKHVTWYICYFLQSQDGVFDTPFMEYLEQRQQPASGATAEERDLAFKIMCRLSNPLLRQPAPFEF
jgi:hypothetical protein